MIIMKFKSLSVLGILLAFLGCSGFAGFIGESGVDAFEGIGVSETVYMNEAEKEVFRSEFRQFKSFGYPDLELNVGEDDFYNWSYFIESLRADGISDIGIAGILGNIKAIGVVKEFTIDGYDSWYSFSNDGHSFLTFKTGGSYDYGELEPNLLMDREGRKYGGEGHGICQWTSDRADKLSDFALNCDYVTITHWYLEDGKAVQHTCHIPDMEGQTAFLLHELNGEYKDVKERLSEASTPSEAAQIFYDGYMDFERPWSRGYCNNAESCLSLVEACTGIY